MTKQDIDTHVGQRLRQRRNMMGLSQEALAKAVGITFQQVQKYEKGVNAMNANRLYEFSQFMRVPISYFFEGVENAMIPEPEEPESGFAESGESFNHGKIVSDRESLEMMKAFKRIREHQVRKRLSDLVRAVADSSTILS